MTARMRETAQDNHKQTNKQTNNLSIEVNTRKQAKSLNDFVSSSDKPCWLKAIHFTQDCQEVDHFSCLSG